MGMQVAAIAAMDVARVIGFQNTIPWHIPGEQKYFAQQTRGHTVLMGRKTFESLPEKVRPLPQRKNVVISRSASADPAYPEVLYRSDPIAFIEDAKADRCSLQGDILWIIGGAQIYSLTAALWDELYLTVVKGKHRGDAFFPDILDEFELVSEINAETHSFQRLRRKAGGPLAG